MRYRLLKIQNQEALKSYTGFCQAKQPSKIFLPYCSSHLLRANGSALCVFFVSL